MEYEYRDRWASQQRVGGTKRVEMLPTSHASFSRISTSELQPMARETRFRLPMDPPARAFRVSHPLWRVSKGASLCVPSSLNYGHLCCDPEA